ncbi:GDP-mannose pyrophosphatase NudK [Namhaeicola litoreus]|uniref:GDP-mannose pyrophosphatase n=1 Tax=Namhaeicola litoreus TaxID=1052145 RepID=A0ABW3Y5M1_9FLAO
MLNPKIKNIEKEVLSDNWYTLYKIGFDYQRKDGSWVRQYRESYDRGNGAGILLYNKEKQTVVLIRQFRMPTYVNGNESGMLVETCAGLLDGQDPETCIINEVFEETGYKIKKVEKVLETYMSPGAVTEIIHLYLGEYTDDMKVNNGGGLIEEQEEIEVLEIPVKTALEWISYGEIIDAKTIILLQYLAIRLKLFLS